MADDDAARLSRAQRFAALFRGSPRAHGTYTVDPNQRDGKKIEGKRWTVKEPPTLLHFVKHLDGSYGLGAVPMLLEPPGGTVWAAIDIDDYDLDPAEFARRCASYGIPGIVCRTKSGGVHVYFFYKEPIQGDATRRKIRVWTKLLGYPDCEIFPKQNELDPNNPEDWGNWINLPYQAGSRTTRYAFGPDGIALNLDEFLNAAEESALTESEFLNYKVEAPPDKHEFLPEAPPCIQRMHANGVPSGGRNQAIFAAATYFKRATPDDIEKNLAKFNADALRPELTDEELRRSAKSANAKNFNYRCKEHPLAGLCDKETCKLRKFGIMWGKDDSGGDEFDLAFGPITRIMGDTSIFRWEIQDTLIDFSLEELKDQKLFMHKIEDMTTTLVYPIKKTAYEKFWRMWYQKSLVKPAPVEVTRDGQLFYYFNRFVTGKSTAKSLDEMIMHKPWVDDATGEVSFIFDDFMQFLTRAGVKVEQRLVFSRFAEKGLQTRNDILKGKLVAYWIMPKVDVQTEDFDVPTPSEDIPF